MSLAFIPCIAQGGPGSIYDGVYDAIMTAIDDYNVEHFGVKPNEVLMIGNDVREDMEPCEQLGIETFLVTDHIITPLVNLLLGLLF